MKGVVRVLVASFLIIGTVIGAGFASGREILVFFSHDVKLYWLIYVTLFFGLFFLSIYFMRIGQLRKINSIGDLLTIKNTKTKSIVSFMLALTFLVSTSSMMAGIDELSKMSLGILFPFASICSFMIATVLVVKGVAGLKFANSILVPVILAFIIAISIYSLRGEVTVKVGNANPPITTIINSVGYSLMNILLAAVVLAKIGEELTGRQIKCSAFFASITIATVVVVFLLAMSCDKDLTSIPMPIIYLAESISKNFSKVASCVIYFGIFTTLIASYYCLYEYIQNYTKTATLSVLVCFALSFSLSRLGFSRIVAIFYPIESALAVILLVCSVQRKQIDLHYLYFMTRRSKSDTK